MLRRKRHPLIEVTKLSSLVATNVEIRGDILFSGGLRIDGRVEGNVLGTEGQDGLLVLSENGGIRGKVRVHDAVINGTIEGDLEVTHFLELQSGARITGNISYHQLKIDCGASIAGKLEKLASPSDSTPGTVVPITSRTKAAPGTG